MTRVNGVSRLTAFDLTPDSGELHTGAARGADIAEVHAWTQDVLAKALLAREENRFQDAAKLYQNALQQCPNETLFLSYAAMEKAQRLNPQQALRILEQAIHTFPKSPKLHEDAGLLAGSIGDSRRALEFLNDALRLSREPGQAGEKGILLNLARTCYRIGGKDRLQEAIKYYELALQAFGPRGLPFQRDKLALGLARVRTQHNRGELAVRFLQGAGFQIVQISSMVK